MPPGARSYPVPLGLSRLNVCKWCAASTAASARTPHRSKHDVSRSHCGHGCFAINLRGYHDSKPVADMGNGGLAVHDAICSEVQIGVAADDHRAFAAEFEGHRNEILGGGMHDDTADSSRPGVDEVVEGQ